jgi:hypothetical protein
MCAALSPFLRVSSKELARQILESIVSSHRTSSAKEAESQSVQRSQRNGSDHSPWPFEGWATSFFNRREYIGTHSPMNNSNMDNLQRWISHSPKSDPGRYLEKITALSSDVGSVICLIQGLLVHGDLAAEYGLDPAKLSPTVRKTLSMVERLQDVLQRDGRPFEAERPPERRSLGTCRDFALMLCSIL